MPSGEMTFEEYKEYMAHFYWPSFVKARTDPKMYELSNVEFGLMFISMDIDLTDESTATIGDIVRILKDRCGKYVFGRMALSDDEEAIEVVYALNRLEGLGVKFSAPEDDRENAF